MRPHENSGVGTSPVQISDHSGKSYEGKNAPFTLFCFAFFFFKEMIFGGTKRTRTEQQIKKEAFDEIVLIT